MTQSDMSWLKAGTLLQSAQINRVTILITDDEAKCIDIECTARTQIFGGQYSVASARYVEWRRI